MKKIIAADYFDMNANEFWLNPPWAGGTRKYRLGLQPLSADVSIVTPASCAVRSHKQALLASAYDAVVATTPIGRIAQAQLLEQSWLPRQSGYRDAVANIAAEIAEDLCLLDLEDEQSLVAGCVCAPSYWSLAEKLGRPLHRIHAPATGLNAVLGGKIHTFIERLPPARPFRRQNWFLHGDEQLFHPAPEAALTIPCEQWVMRSEVQTLYKLSPRFVLFAIRIICLGLNQITAYPSARRDLVLALSAMSEDEITHFGGQDKYTRLLNWLNSLQAQTGEVR